jgi:hypothetical protein
LEPGDSPDRFRGPARLRRCRAAALLFFDVIPAQGE